MQLTQEQCIGLDDMMLESGMTPSAILDGSREGRRMKTLSSLAIELTVFNPTGGSFHPSKTLPHALNLVTGTGRRMPTRPFDHEE